MSYLYCKPNLSQAQMITWLPHFFSHTYGGTQLSVVWDGKHKSFWILPPPCPSSYVLPGSDTLAHECFSSPQSEYKLCHFL